MLMNCLSAHDKLQYSEACVIHPGNCGLQLKNVDSSQKKDDLTAAGISVVNILSDHGSTNPVGTYVLIIGPIMKRNVKKGKLYSKSFFAFSANEVLCVVY